jgi:superfamily II RNA helicase
LLKRRFLPKKRERDRNFLLPPPEVSLRISPQVAQALKQIGVPEAIPFVPDEFQVEAVRLAALGDVIVSAPTGSGKTWIAEQVIAQKLALRERVWYASPLKALSNAKFLEFTNIFGSNQVGLLTGDHKVNPDAPLVIGTTEILRNQLYDLMSGECGFLTDLVILDEAHYLGDKDRGMVWEEVLIYLPARVSLLLLSATVANPEELAAWLAYNRGREPAVVLGGVRPVPLAGMCLLSFGHLMDLAGAASRLSSHSDRKDFFQQQTSSYKTMNVLKKLDLLPAIFFLKSRKDCDVALSQNSGLPREEPARFQARSALVDRYLDKYPFLAGHPHLGRIRRGAAAAHHAGHLPHYKLLVEDLMNRGLLDVIFATSTVSAGVNFPARTVVIYQSDRFNGQAFSTLTATEFTQMTGRAGRRGRDQIGFVLVVPGPYLNLQLMARLFNAPPDPVRSALSIKFPMVLNLLNAYCPSEVKELLAASLASWQEVFWEGGSVVTRWRGGPPAKALVGAADSLYLVFQRHQAFLAAEGLVDQRGRLTPDGQWAINLRLDHPLVFYAGLKARAWPLTPAALASAVAAFISEKKSNLPPLSNKPPIRLSQALARLILAVSPMINRLQRAGFDIPSISMRSAWAIWSWVTRGDFDEAMALLGLGAGDLTMLALRSADHLRQIAGLAGCSELSAAAREAICLIMREPISSPLQVVGEGEEKFGLEK